MIVKELVKFLIESQIPDIKIIAAFALGIAMIQATGSLLLGLPLFICAFAAEYKDLNGFVNKIGDILNN